ncbi:MAG: [FeFe] hydrogenase H-cluster maturation GTPase HydF [Spirochaetaceae bacterium]|jgi:[FeFe] hydrogenase H-cluster maturation GTPase HydF|nr:[FeFe] hydrogenase H-cluster maturation GTPase HydF [Spirochaetaceae bacterium]
MGNMNETPQSERVHIGFFGRRNAGKSSLVNAFTGQDLVIVSDVKGTTTDPVAKSMELLPIGPVLIIDTPGIDDEGALGELRVRKAKKVLNKTDIAALVVDATLPISEAETELIGIFRAKNVPFIVVYNKCDLLTDESLKTETGDFDFIYVSAQTGEGITALKERVSKLVNTGDPKLKIAGDLIKAGDVVVLVTPIDSAAPKGRLILPQQQTIRDIEEADGIAVVATEKLFKAALDSLKNPPALVITDSQAFAKVSAETPQDVPLTSFSILFARYKGFLETALRGVTALDTLKDTSRVLVCEGCTHHRQCDDIGTVKMPRWVKEYSKKSAEFVFRSGGDFPDDLSEYHMVIHCRPCMLNDREMHYRQKCASDQNVPFTNYGTAIAHMQGILKRSIQIVNKKN